METFVQWATILSPIIAVLLAWWTSRSGARDTAKLVKNIKKLMHIQLQIKMLELSKEAKEEHIQFDNLSFKSQSLKKQSDFNFYDPAIEASRQREEKENDIYAQKSLSFDRRKIIAETMSDMVKLSKEIEKI